MNYIIGLAVIILLLLIANASAQSTVRIWTSEDGEVTLEGEPYEIASTQYLWVLKMAGTDLSECEYDMDMRMLDKKKHTVIYENGSADIVWEEIKYEIEVNVDLHDGNITYPPTVNASYTISLPHELLTDIVIEVEVNASRIDTWFEENGYPYQPIPDKEPCIPQIEEVNETPPEVIVVNATGPPPAEPEKVVINATPVPVINISKNGTVNATPLPDNASTGNALDNTSSAEPEAADNSSDGVPSDTREPDNVSTTPVASGSTELPPEKYEGIIPPEEETPAGVSDDGGIDGPVAASKKTPAVSTATALLGIFAALLGKKRKVYR